MEEKKRTRDRGEILQEAISWLFALGLTFLASVSPIRAVPGYGWQLYLVTGLVALSAIVIYRLIPASAAGRLRYSSEDRLLVGNLVLFVLLTVYCYLNRGQSPHLAFLYLVPIIAGTVTLDERFVGAEVALGFLAVFFLRALAWFGGPFFSAEFIMELAVFAAVAVVVMPLAWELRLVRERSMALSRELSQRLDQMQTVGVIVKQAVLFTDTKALFARLADILASAFDVEIAGVVLLEPGRGSQSLRAVTTDSPEGQWCEFGSTGSPFQRVIEKSESVIISEPYEWPGSDCLFGKRRLVNMMIAPLRDKETLIGAVFAANKRRTVFQESDPGFMEILAGYVSALVSSSLMFQKMSREREIAERMAKLMAGREVRMRELKDKLEKVGGL